MIHSSSVKESVVEDYLVDQVEAMGGVAEKVTVIGTRGFYDRLVVLPGGRIIFVECKKPRRSRISPHQRARHTTYRRLGAEVAVVKTLADVDRLLGKGVDQTDRFSGQLGHRKS